MGVRDDEEGYHDELLQCDLENSSLKMRLQCLISGLEVLGLDAAHQFRSPTEETDTGGNAARWEAFGHHFGCEDHETSPMAEHGEHEHVQPFGASGPATPDKDEGDTRDDQESQAIQESVDNAVEYENNAVQRAIVETKVVQSEDGIVLLQLNRHAESTEVVNVLMHAPILQACRDRVLHAQCELRPEWANGAWILVPMTSDIFAEAEGGVSAQNLFHFHVLVLRQDEDLVREALTAVPRAKRPMLCLAKFREASVSKRGAVETTAVDAAQCGTLEHDGHAVTDETAQQGSLEHWGHPEDATQWGASEFGEFEIVVERTFISLRQINVSSSSHSAPARLEHGGGELS